jgi:hypothetical protein
MCSNIVLAEMINALIRARDVLVVLGEHHLDQCKWAGTRDDIDAHTLAEAVRSIDDAADRLHDLKPEATPRDRSATRDWKLAGMVRGLDAANDTIDAMRELIAYPHDLGDDVDVAGRVVEEVAEYLHDLRVTPDSRGRLPFVVMGNGYCSIRRSWAIPNTIKSTAPRCAAGCANIGRIMPSLSMLLPGPARA